MKSLFALLAVCLFSPAMAQSPLQNDAAATFSRIREIRDNPHLIEDQLRIRPARGKSLPKNFDKTRFLELHRFEIAKSIDTLALDPTILRAPQSPFRDEYIRLKVDIANRWLNNPFIEDVPVDPKCFVDACPWPKPSTDLRKAMNKFERSARRDNESSKADDDREKEVKESRKKVREAYDELVRARVYEAQWRQAEFDKQLERHRLCVQHGEACDL